MNKECEGIVIGGGPAGLTAGLYAARSKPKSLILELGKLMHEQATKYGLETLSANVAGIELQNEQRKVVKTTRIRED